MHTSTASPKVNSPGPRNPIRVWRGDGEPSAPQPSDYLTTFEDAMTRAFVLAFRHADRKAARQ